jgi:transcriptional regulator GlxA family with amidase domain
MQSTIDFLLFPDALGLDVTGPLEVFNTAAAVLERRGKQHCGYRARFVAARNGPVGLSSGLEVNATASFKEPSTADILIVPGGRGAAQAAAETEVIAYVRRRAKQVKRLISVCNGAFILAAAGLLNGRQATTHWLATEALARSYPKVKVQPEAIFTRDGNIYTSAGVTTGIDLALAVVEEDFGAALALEVSRILVLYYRRPGGQSQFSAPLEAQAAAGSRFAGLHDWLVARLDRPISVEQMAGQAAMSPRNFARVFKAKTGMTPVKYLETLRLDRARELLATGHTSLNLISEISGFGREERLRRAFVRRFKVTPSQYRLHFRGA